MRAAEAGSALLAPRPQPQTRMRKVSYDPVREG